MSDSERERLIEEAARALHSESINSFTHPSDCPFCRKRLIPILRKLADDLESRIEAENTKRAKAVLDVIRAENERNQAERNR